MRSSLIRALVVLSSASYAFAYEYDASGVRTGATVVKGIFALVFIALTGLAIPVLAMARGHRVPYIPLLIALILSIFHDLSAFAYDLLAADIDIDDDIPGEAYTATLGISELFLSWSLALVFLAFAHLIKVRADKLMPPSKGQGLSFIWTIGYLAAFFIVFVFATASSGLYIDYMRNVFEDSDITGRELNRKGDIRRSVYYTFNAMWYAASIFLGVLSFFAYSKARRAGIQDTVLKILLFVAYPIHMLHIIQSFIFLILWSPSGLSRSFRNLDTLERAALADTLLYLLLHAATIAVLVIVGLRRSNWLTPAELNNGQRGQYPSYRYYPAQTVYPAQAAYPGQTDYQRQSQYVDNTRP